MTDNMPETLVINGITYVRQGVELDECGRQECGYYKHYLVWYDSSRNGEKLDHVPYHEAERRCIEAQKRLSDWMDTHDGDPEILAPHLLKQADHWERRVAA